MGVNLGKISILRTCEKQTISYNGILVDFMVVKMSLEKDYSLMIQ